MSNVVIVAAGRTAIGKFNGTLAKVTPMDLGAKVISTLIERTGLDKASVDEVILGHILTAGLGQHTARQAAIKAGLPVEVPSTGINKLCGSGLKSVVMGAQAIKCGDAQVIIAGGQENMTMSPHVLMGGRDGFRMGNATLEDTMIKDGLTDVYNQYHMGITAENLAAKYEISREDQDAFALASQTKAKAAQDSGKFKDEIIPVEIVTRKETIVFDQDEFINGKTTAETLAKLKPAFKKDGTVTAGNASGINDGAAAVILMSEEKAKELGLPILGRIVSYASAGVDPSLMGYGPVPASQKCLELAGWTHEELDLIEANEAFAAQALSVNKGMGWDTSKINVNGGAIALGHPIGASGARILVTLLYEMARRDAKKGLATLCIGGGMGIALAIQRD